MHFTSNSVLPPLVTLTPYLKSATVTIMSHVKLRLIKPFISAWDCGKSSKQFL